jgi:hypothetical protein
MAFLRPLNQFLYKKINSTQVIKFHLYCTHMHDILHNLSKFYKTFNSYAEFQLKLSELPQSVSLSACVSVRPHLRTQEPFYLILCREAILTFANTFQSWLRLHRNNKHFIRISTYLSSLANGCEFLAFTNVTEQIRGT